MPDPKALIEYWQRIVDVTGSHSVDWDARHIRRVASDRLFARREARISALVRIPAMQPHAGSTHMAPGKSWLNGRVPASRRSFVKGLGAAGAALAGMAMLPRWGFADDYAAMYASAAIDWKQFAGQTITLAGATHPWSKAIGPLLPQFTKLTGINVVTEFQQETEYPGRAADQARARQHDARRLHVLPMAWASRRDGSSRWPPIIRTSR